MGCIFKKMGKTKYIRLRQINYQNIAESSDSIMKDQIKACQNLTTRIIYGMATSQINLSGMKKRVFQIQQTKKISELKLKIFHKKRRSKPLLKQNNTVLCFCS